MIDHHAIREQHFMGVAAHERCDPMACSQAAIGALVDELDRLHTWDGLMSLVDEHYPVDVFPVEPDRDGRDPGPRVLSLLRRLTAVRALHSGDAAFGREDICMGCEIKGVAFRWLDDCPTLRALDKPTDSQGDDA